MESLLSVSIGSWVIPGDKLGPLNDPIHWGEGTYIRNAHAYAQRAGRLLQLEDSSLIIAQSSSNLADQVVRVNQIVLAKVVRMNRALAILQIQAIYTEQGETQRLDWPVAAILRRENIQIAEMPKMIESVRPNDLVLARVLALGSSTQSSSPSLSTAEPLLGVVLAMSSDGVSLRPVAWNTVVSKDGKHSEPRKCAQPRRVV